MNYITRNVTVEIKDMLEMFYPNIILESFEAWSARMTRGLYLDKTSTACVLLPLENALRILSTHRWHRGP